MIIRTSRNENIFVTFVRGVFMKSRMKCIVCTMLLVLLTACSNEKVKIEDACDKWEQALRVIIEDDVRKICRRL